MDDSASTRVWPFTLAVVGLVALTILAPRDWEQIARDRPMPRLQANAAGKRGTKAAARVTALPKVPPAPVVPVRVYGQPTLAAPQAPQPLLVVQPPAATVAIDAPVSPEESEPLQAEPSLLDDDLVEQTPQTPPAAIVVTPTSGWPRPGRLLAELDELAESDALSTWAREVATLVEQLTGSGESPSLAMDGRLQAAQPRRAGATTVSFEPSATEPDPMPGNREETSVAAARRSILARRAAVSRLRDLSRDAVPLARSLPPDGPHGKLLRVRYSLVRRLDLWDLLTAEDGALAVIAPARPAPAELVAAIDRVQSLLDTDKERGAQWQGYLKLDALRAALHQADGPTVESLRPLAAEVHDRLTRQRLAPEQRAFLHSEPLTDLAAQLARWTAEPVDLGTVLATVERFEETAQPSDAKLIAQYCRYASWSKHADASRLHDHLESNYRNANLRFVVSAELLNTLVPEIPDSDEYVRDQVLGVPTRGTSHRTSRLSVQLVPDPQRLSVALVAEGEIYTNTRSTSGPATLHSTGESTFVARKPIDISLAGLRGFTAETAVSPSAQLRSVSSRFDGVPLLGSVVQGVARSRHDELRGDAYREIGQKINTRVREQVDTLADERLAEANRRLRQHFLEPMDRLGIDRDLISTSTTDQRMTARVRLAAADQLAGSTPRPQAPGDSLASIQLHESVLNNVLVRLDLDGRRSSVTDLREHLAGNLNMPAIVRTGNQEEEDDLFVTFADSDAVQIRCGEGVVDLDLKLAELRSGARVWRNFTVRVHYKPIVTRNGALLAREGVVELPDGTLGIRSQVAVRGIFSKIFAPDRRLPVFLPTWSDRAAAELAVSQFVVDDGWMALAVGGNASSPAARTARKP